MSSTSRPPLVATGTSRSQEERKEIRHRLRHQPPLRRKWTQFMHTDLKNHMVAMVGEFIGTFLFLFFSFAGTGVAQIDTPPDTPPNIGALFYISASFGFSLIVNAWIFYRISGGLFNPAVTLAMALLQAITPLRALLLFLTQLMAAIFSSYIVDVLFPTPFSVTTVLSPGVSIAQGLFIEVICTTELVFTIIMLAKEKHRATYIAPLGIGLALFLAEMISVNYTGGSLNPARSLGPSVVTGNFSGVDWIYWLGPAMGSCLAVGFYKGFKFMEYEMANPGQDGDVETDPTRNLMHVLARVNSDRRVEIEELRAVRSAGGFGNESQIEIIGGPVHVVDLEAGLKGNV